MLSTQHAKLAAKILALVLVGTLSFFVLTSKLPETNFIKNSIESVENSEDMVMRFSAATLSASLAITLLPDDVATPLADSFADMSVYFIAILVVLLFEKMLILYGVKLTFAYVIPIACAIGIVSILLRRDALKSLAIRLSILGLAVALVVPCSTHITNYVAADLTEYVEATIISTEGGADKINEAANSTTEEKTIFENLTDLFKTAINGISDLLLHVRNTVRQCMTSIAIMFLTNCLMPLLNFFLLRWILKETFHIQIAIPEGRRKRRSESASEPNTDDSERKLIEAGE